MKASRIPRTALFVVAALSASLSVPASSRRPIDGGPETPSLTLRGRVELLSPGHPASPASGAIVWIPGLPWPERRPGPPGMASKEKRFDPHVLVVPRGTRVGFPNLDRIFHNAFSRTPGSEFDLGLYRNGDSREVLLTKPGLVRVFCNIHPKMAAYVMVLDQAAYALTGDDGTFRIANVPEGPVSLHVWHERGGEKELGVTVAASRDNVVTVPLDASIYRDVPHKNKYGEDYPKGRGDERY